MKAWLWLFGCWPQRQTQTTHLNRQMQFHNLTQLTGMKTTISFIIPAFSTTTWRSLACRRILSASYRAWKLLSGTSKSSGALITINCFSVTPGNPLRLLATGSENNADVNSRKCLSCFFGASYLCVIYVCCNEKLVARAKLIAP
jgi:hypothetical protein